MSGPSETTCVVPGCSNERLGRGLCSIHYGRWTQLDKPNGEQLQAWIAAGAPSKREMKKNGGALPPRHAAKARPRQQPEQVQQPAESAQLPVPAGQGLAAISLTFDQPVTGVQLVRTGKFLSVFDSDGRFLQQIPA